MIVYIKEWGTCDCCRSQVPLSEIKEEEWKEYEQDSETKKRNSCHLCRMMFPVTTQPGSRYKPLYQYDLSSTFYRDLEKARVEKEQAVRKVIRRFWCDLQSEIMI